MRRIVDQADQQRRHHLEMGDLVLLDQLEHLLGARGGREHHLAALEEKPCMPGHASGRLCAIGSTSSSTESPVTAAHRGRGPGVVRVVVVRARDELGDPGGAARKLEDARIGGVDADLRPARSPAARAFSVDRACCRRGAVKMAMLEVRVLRLHPPDHRLEVEIALALGIEARRRAGELHELVDFGEAVRRAARRSEWRRSSAARNTASTNSAMFGSVGTTRSSGFRPSSSRFSARLSVSRRPPA